MQTEGFRQQRAGNRSLWAYAVMNTRLPGLPPTPASHLRVNSFSLFSTAFATPGVFLSERQLHEAHGGLSGCFIVRFKRQLQTFSVL